MACNTSRALPAAAWVSLTALASLALGPVLELRHEFSHVRFNSLIRRGQTKVRPLCPTTTPRSSFQLLPPLLLSRRVPL
jgi:hypothetical protein